MIVHSKVEEKYFKSNPGIQTGNIPYLMVDQFQELSGEGEVLQNDIRELVRIGSAIVSRESIDIGHGPRDRWKVAGSLHAS